MPKLIIDKNKFLKGIAETDKDAQGAYALGGVDLFSDYGYLKPTYEKSELTLTGYDYVPADIVVDPVNSRDYVIGCSRTFGINTENDTDLGDTFGGGSQNYVVIAGLFAAKGLIVYVTADSAYRVLLFFSGTRNDIAKGVLSNNWSGANLDQDWGSSIPTGGATLNAGGRDATLWKSYVWFTNGRYVGKLDTYSATPVMTPQAFDLGVNWSADRLFQTPDYLGIVASNLYLRQTRVYLIDFATNLYRIIPLEGMSSVTAVANLNGTILLFGTSLAADNVVGMLNNYGLDEAKILQHDISGVLYRMTAPANNNCFDIQNGKLLFITNGGNRVDNGVNGGGGVIFQFGKKNINADNILTMPYSLATAISSAGYVIKRISTTKLYVGYFNGSNYKIAKLVTSGGTYTTSAVWKDTYTDFGQSVRINYIKAYFKPLVSGDSNTLGLDLDYGKESITLGIGSGNIKYGNDGAITKKRFDIKKVCHALRPTWSWLAGGTPVSKIVIDYDFVDDI